MGEDLTSTIRLRRVFRVQIVLTIVFLAAGLPVYYLDRTAGLAVTVLTAAYFLICLVLYFRCRKGMRRELVDFGSRQGRLLRQLADSHAVASALLDRNGKLLWMNDKFAQMTECPKDSHRSIMSIFPRITKEKLQKEDDIDLVFDYQEYILRAHLQKVSISSWSSENPAAMITEQMEDTGPGQEPYVFQNMRREDISGWEPREAHADAHPAASPQSAQDETGELYITALYLFDETRLRSYEKELKNSQLVAGLIYIDNYDEVADAVEDVKRSMLMAIIDRKITRFFSAADGLVKKTEPDKYFVIFRYGALETMSEQRFKLLEDVKTIRMGNERPVTLSMGFGYAAGGSYAKNNEYARSAIELALGRGGDQAVLKIEGQTKYFGGNTQMSGSNTRVKARVKALALREIMVSHEKFYIMGHSIADVDAFGAAIGIYCAARQLGKFAQIVLGDVSSSLRPFRELFTPENGYQEDMIITPEKALLDIEPGAALIVVDTNRPGYTECPQLIGRAKTVVVFDHHRAGAEMIRNATLSYIEPYASSTCEMIAEVLQYFDEDIRLSAQEADVLYAGVLIDTNNFVTKTGVRTFEAAAYLRRSGAEVTRVRKMLRNDLAAYKARAEAIRLTEVYRKCYAISVCPAENVESPTIASAQAANEMLNIIGIRASFVLTDFRDRIYISARSIDEINVQRVMEHLGGGGHMNTAGAQLRDCSLDEGIVLIKRTLDEMIANGEITERNGK